MIQRTRWWPDTCDCVLVFEWDDALPKDQRVHTGAVVETACADHAQHKDDPKAHHDAILTENQAKNVAVHQAAIAAGWVDEVRDVSGKVILVAAVNPDKAPDTFAWSFDAQRKVTVSATVILAVVP